MITLDAIVGLQVVYRRTEIMCYACHRSRENNIFLYRPSDPLATYLYFPSCGHMEVRETTGAWRPHKLHASAQAYLMLLGEGEWS